MNWLAPDDMRALGMALLHFLWQGAALTALLGIFLAFCRRATVRYAVAVLTLALMVGAPVVTFIVIRHAGSVAWPVAADSSPVAAASEAAVPTMPSNRPQSSPSPRISGWWRRGSPG